MPRLIHLFKRLVEEEIDSSAWRFEIRLIRRFVLRYIKDGRLSGQAMYHSVFAVPEMIYIYWSWGQTHAFPITHSGMCVTKEVCKAGECTNEPWPMRVQRSGSRQLCISALVLDGMEWLQTIAIGKLPKYKWHNDRCQRRTKD